MLVNMPTRSCKLSALLLLSSLLSLSAFSQAQQSSSGSSSGSTSGNAPVYAKEKAPSLVDPAGPAISLVPSETLFFMASALNSCGYDEGLAESDPIRQHVRDQINAALATSEAARDKRDKLCLYIAQHRMTGSVKDVTQYVSLSLYLTPPPDLETSAELPEMPPDATQVVEVLPLLRDFALAVDLHGIWLTNRHSYDEIVNTLHDPLTKMIVGTNVYLKMPASTYDGRRFLVVVEPLLSPRTINARIYGPDFVVVASPVAGNIRMADVRHTYLHYIIEPLLYSRATAMDRFLPILKYVHDAPLEYQYRSDIVDLTIECLIKAIEARTMDTGIANYVLPPDAKRSDFEKIEHDKGVISAKQEAVRQARVRHETTQGWVLTPYFYEQIVGFEKDPASLKDTIGELVYTMDIDHEINRIKHVEFDQEADGDPLRRVAPRKLTGLDLAEARLAAGDTRTAQALAQEALRIAPTDTSVDAGRANFILARAAAMTGQPEQAINGFRKAVTQTSVPRIRAWSHIYLGRMLDLDCHRDSAIGEYKAALEVRDGQLDTRLAAERGVKAAYSVNGHSCEAEPSAADDDEDDDAPADKPAPQPKPATPPKH